MSIYVKFTKTAHQILSCHVTLTSNFENVYLSLNFVLNFRKVTKFEGNWLKNKTVKGKKPIGGGKHPPSVCRFKLLAVFIYNIYSELCSYF